MWIILLVWLAYTVAAFLEFVPGLLAVTTLVMAGLSLQECHLRIAPISRTGLMLLTVSFLFMPFIVFTGRWIGWNWMAVLIYAPASGISQELFFRAALLPALTATFKARPFLAVLIHSLLFAL
jgi:membrane protease YdiL (CAAX protease family)